MEDESAKGLVPGLVYGAIGLAILAAVIGDLFRGRLISRQRGRGDVDIGVSRLETPGAFYTNIVVYTLISLPFLAGAAAFFAPKGLGLPSAGGTTAMVVLGVAAIAILKRDAKAQP